MLIDISVELVKKLIKEQFPQFSHLEIKPVEFMGHDNRTFYLGNQMSIRLPSSGEYASQVEKEWKWLNYLADKLSMPIRKPLFLGKGNSEYPYSFLINQWIDGEELNDNNIDSKNDIAKDLGKFLKTLQSIDSSNGPLAGDHNFFRGGNLKVYETMVLDSTEFLKEVLPKKDIENLWDLAVKSTYEGKPLWIHGDIACGNILIKENRINGIIDFGQLGIGDPACDYVMAWTYFDKSSKDIFLEELQCDINMKNRAMGWALWKALITFDLANPNGKKSQWAKKCIENIFKDYKISY